MEPTASPDRLDTLPRPYRLLTPTASLAPFDGDDAAWESAAQWVEQQGLEGVAHSMARGREGVPEHLAERWAQASRAIAIETLMHQQSLDRALKILEASGIEAVILKGAFLAFHLYPDIGTRPMADLDLLFRTGDDALAAFASLEKEGFTPGNNGGRPREIDRSIHQLPVLVAPNGTMFDLHWRLGHDRDGRLTGDEYWQRTITRPLLGHEVRYPSLADQATHLVGHAVVQNNLLNGAIVLPDLAQLIASPEFDAAAFAGRLRDHKLERAAAPLLAIVRRLRPDLKMPLLEEEAAHDVDDGVAILVALLEADRLGLKDSFSLLGARQRDLAARLARPDKADRDATSSRRAHWFNRVRKIPRLLQADVGRALWRRYRLQRWLGR